MGKNILKGNRVLFMCLIALVLLSISSVSALNAKVGNGKFVISNATVGEVIERSMKIYNNNSFEIIIELVPSGNLSQYIKIIDNNITMAPNSEREFSFSVKVPKEGRNDGGINVKFTPVNMTANGKNGIVIPTTMIIFATKGTGGKIDWTSWLGSGNKNETSSGTDPVTGNNPGNGIGIGTILMITAIVFIVLLILLFVYSKRKNGVKEGKGEKLNTKKEIHK